MEIYLELDDYLRQWFLNDHSFEVPIQLRRGGIESLILEQFLRKPRKNDLPETPAADAVPIRIPEFKGKPSQYWFVLGTSGRAALVDAIRNRFDADLWTHLHPFERGECRLDVLLYAFMEKRSIEINTKNFDAVTKRYQRMRRRYDDRERKRNRPKKCKKKELSNIPKPTSR